MIVHTQGGIKVGSSLNHSALFEINRVIGNFINEDLSLLIFNEIDPKAVIFVM